MTRENMTRRQAETVSKALENSIKQYYAAYNRWPVADTSSVLRSDEKLIAALSGMDLSLNPKRIQFLPESLAEG
ncbi:MAG: hypothetical protein ACR2OZ_01210 [Verrucomicrobiales bacterium]